MTDDEQAAPHRGRLRRWLAGWTLRARLIAGLIALFAVASAGVGLVTTAELSGFLLNRLDQQVNSAGQELSHLIEDAQPDGGGTGIGPGQGPGQDVEPTNPNCHNANSNSGQSGSI